MKWNGPDCRTSAINKNLSKSINSNIGWCYKASYSSSKVTRNKEMLARKQVVTECANYKMNCRIRPLLKNKQDAVGETFHSLKVCFQV